MTYERLQRRRHADRCAAGRVRNLVVLSIHPKDWEDCYDQPTLHPSMTTAWQRDAACREVQDPEVFYPKTQAGITSAKQICAPCPVRRDCLQFALDTQSVDRDYGIFGGTTARERRQLRPAPPPQMGLTEAQARDVQRRAGVIGVSQAAREVGVTPRSLRRIWQRHGLHPPTDSNRTAHALEAVS